MFKILKFLSLIKQILVFSKILPLPHLSDIICVKWIEFQTWKWDLCQSHQSGMQNWNVSNCHSSLELWSPFSISHIFDFREWKMWKLYLQQSSAGGPSVLDSSEISLENGRTSRFPRPELEISFSPLQPNRMALRRQGQDSAVTVKITRSTRKRKSEEMDKVRSNQIKVHLQQIVLKRAMTHLTRTSISSNLCHSYHVVKTACLLHTIWWSGLLRVQ